MLRVTSDQYLPLHLRQVFEDLWSTFASLNTEFTASLTEILRWRLKTSSVQSSLSWSFMCKYGKSGWVFSDGGAWSPAFTSVTFMSSMMLYVTCSWLVEGACWECLSVSVDRWSLPSMPGRHSSMRAKRRAAWHKSRTLHEADAQWRHWF